MEERGFPLYCCFVLIARNAAGSILMACVFFKDYEDYGLGRRAQADGFRKRRLLIEGRSSCLENMREDIKYKKKKRKKNVKTHRVPVLMTEYV